MLEELKNDHIRIGKYRIRALSFLWFVVRIVESLLFLIGFYFLYAGFWLLTAEKKKKEVERLLFFIHERLDVKRLIFSSVKFSLLQIFMS